MDTYFFDKLSDDWRREQDRCLREIARHQQADRSYIEEGIGLLEMAGNAQRLFAQEPPLQKRRLLNFVLSNCSWSDGELRATFRQPFDLLAETAAIAAQVDKNQGQILGERSGWLGN
jgi:site-specific DNA recombinase